MSRILAYCAFLEDGKLSLPPTGVNQAPVHVLEHEGLRWLWSEVEWPFEQGSLQRNALEFHEVVKHVFSQTAVAPFRLLSVFETYDALKSFAAGHRREFTADLERLREFVQMESVIYVIAPRIQPEASSGRAYLERRAELARAVEEHAAAVRDAVAKVSNDVRVRDTRNGKRIFALVQRGAEEKFRLAVEQVALSGQISRRMSGPWPAAEFLSQEVKTPQTVEQP